MLYQSFIINLESVDLKYFLSQHKKLKNLKKNFYKECKFPTPDLDNSTKIQHINMNIYIWIDNVLSKEKTEAKKHLRNLAIHK